MMSRSGGAWQSTAKCLGLTTYLQAVAPSQDAQAALATGIAAFFSKHKASHAADTASEVTVPATTSVGDAAQQGRVPVPQLSLGLWRHVEQLLDDSTGLQLGSGNDALVSWLTSMLA